MSTQLTEQQIVQSNLRWLTRCNLRISSVCVWKETFGRGFHMLVILLPQLVDSAATADQWIQLETMHRGKEEWTGLWNWAKSAWEVLWGAQPWSCSVGNILSANQCHRRPPSSDKSVSSCHPHVSPPSSSRLICLISSTADKQYIDGIMVASTTRKGGKNGPTFICGIETTFFNCFHLRRNWGMGGLTLLMGGFWNFNQLAKC